MSESREIAERQEGGAVQSANALGDVAAMLNMMRELAMNPDIDAAKFETIARVANEQQDRAQRQQFYQAKAAALIEMPVIRKDGKIVIEKQGQEARVQGTFAKWPDLQRAINPILHKHGLFLTHEVGHEGAFCLVTPVLGHRNGFVEKGEQMSLPLDTSGGKNNTQGAGSAASYGKRHTTIAHLGIRLEDSDDDGWLTALPDEPLNDQQQRRVEEAQARATEGQEAYAQWFRRLAPADRAWMIQTGRHAQFGGEALPGAAPVPKHNVDTPDGWTAQYEEDCAKAKTLTELAGIQQKGAGAITRLKREGLDALHERAIKAGTDAHARLQPSGKGAED